MVNLKMSKQRHIFDLQCIHIIQQLVYDKEIDKAGPQEYDYQLNATPLTLNASLDATRTFILTCET